MALADFRYRLDIRVVFRDVDYYRHVNNAVYVTYMETARMDYCAAVFRTPLDSVQNVIMASQRFDYERQAQYDDRLVMGCRCSRFGTKSLDLTFELWRADERVGHGVCTLVAFDYAQQRPIPVPDAWRRRVTEYEVVAPEPAVSAPGGGGS